MHKIINVLQLVRLFAINQDTITLLSMIKKVLDIPGQQNIRHFKLSLRHVVKYISDKWFVAFLKVQ